MLDIFEFDGEEKRELLELRESAKRRGWWAQYSALLSDDVQRLYGLEHGAQSIRDYENLLIPGLLQTAEYARAVFAADVAVRPVEVDQRVEIRLQRQQRLTGEDPLHLTAVISVFGASTFHLIDFESSRLPTLAWQETVTTRRIVDDKISVRDLSLTYTDALGRALSTQDSLNLINRCAKELA